MLIEGLTYDQAKEKEIELIKQYDTTNRDKGYNISPGGDLSGRVNCESVICLENMKTYPSMIEAANDLNVFSSQISDMCRHIVRQVKGYHILYEDEALALIGKCGSSEQAIEYIKSIPSKQYTSVICIEDNCIFGSVKEAAEKYKVHQSGISMACSRKSQFTAKGKHFMRYEDYINRFSDYENLSDIIDELTKEDGSFRGSKNPAAKKVVCLDDGIAYGCLSDAGRAYNISYSCITNVCEGRQRLAAGRKFMYYDEYIQQGKQPLKYA